MAATAEHTLYTCWTCCLPATRVCGRCKLARYCSRQCQAQQWATHKAHCREGAVLRIVRQATGAELLAEFYPQPGDRHYITKGALQGLLSEAGHSPDLQGLEAGLVASSLSAREWHDWWEVRLTKEHLKRVSDLCRAWIEEVSGERLPELATLSPPQPSGGPVREPSEDAVREPSEDAVREAVERASGARLPRLSARAEARVEAAYKAAFVPPPE